MNWLVLLLQVAFIKIPNHVYYNPTNQSTISIKQVASAITIKLTPSRLMGLAGPIVYIERS